MTDVAGRLSSLTPSERTLPGYLFWLSRPRFWLYLAGPVIVGVVYGAAGPGEVVQPITVALFAYFLLPANLFLYGINDIFDADIDALNPKKAEDGREVQYTGSRAVAAVVAGATLLGAAFVPFLPRTALLPFAGFYLLGVAYSAPPLRFKTTPFLDSLSNGLYVLPALVSYATLTGSFPPALAVAGGWIWAMGMHTFSAIPDIEPDRAAGIHTTATLLGERRTLAYCGACWLAAAGLMTWLHPFLGGVFAVYPLFVAGIVAGSVAVSRAYWWFPAVNTLAGMVLTLGGIWGLIHG
ncbi:lycopene elongase [Halobacteriales archaeon SW_10_66_29]|nr:MAG: lycopene elongase [Halobacteriales archaeon SW_10_66_29]